MKPLLVLAMIVVMAAPAHASDRWTRHLVQVDLRTMADALHNYYLDHLSFPRDRQELARLAPYFGGGPQGERFRNPYTGATGSFTSPSGVVMAHGLSQMLALAPDKANAGKLLYVFEGKRKAFLRILDRNGRPGEPVLKVEP